MSDSSNNPVDSKSVLGNIAEVVTKNAQHQARSLKELGDTEDNRPSLRMKSIATWNVWGMPWYSKDLPARMPKWSQYIHDSMAEHQELSEEDLVVVGVQEAWGYRVGMLGWPVMWAGYKNSACCDTHGLAGLINRRSKHNIQANDHELLAGLWGVGMRSIPLLNAGIWDPKRTIARGLVKRTKQLVALQKKAERAVRKAEDAEHKAKKAQQDKIEKMRKKAEEARRQAEQYTRLAREAEEQAIREANKIEEELEAEESKEDKEGAQASAGAGTGANAKDTDSDKTTDANAEGLETLSIEDKDSTSDASANGKTGKKGNKPLVLSYAYGSGSSNKSISGMFDFASYGFKPLLDSGCALYANKPAREHGFERWNTWGDAGWMEDMANKGIVWAYFEAPNRKKGMCVMTLHIAGASPAGTEVAQLKQLVLLKAKLEQKFSSRVMNYETYVAGDFNVEFGKRHEDDRILEKWNILRRGGFSILSESDTGSTCGSNKEIDFVMYAPDEINHADTLKDLSTIRTMFEESAHDTRPVKETELSDHWLVRVDVEYGQ